jgi:DNA polymerase-4
VAIAVARLDPVLCQTADVPGSSVARSILHVDMDAFYAAVEVLDDPALKGKPLIVGGTGRRGVVASCSYEARTYGVRSAMPSGQARRLCGHAVFLAPRFERYAQVSSSIHSIFGEYTPLVEGIALDEAFLDVTGSQRLFGPAPDIAVAIRGRVAAELNLACSVGVAPVKFLAKLASEAAKPRATPGAITAGAGVVVVEPGQELTFLHPMPIESLWGVGPATAGRLRRLGVTTVGDLATVPTSVLEATVGGAHGRHLAQLAQGIDDRAVEPNREVKSVSHEETYPVDVFDRGELGQEIVRMADAVASRMRRAGLVGRTVGVKIRYGDFATLTRSRTVPSGLAEGPSIAAIAGSLLDAVDVSPGVRLLGVGVSNLSPANQATVEQMSLELEASPVRGGTADTPSEQFDSWRQTSGAVDAIRGRFGDEAVGPARRVGNSGLRLKRPGDTQWGPLAGDVKSDGG